MPLSSSTTGGAGNRSGCSRGALAKFGCKSPSGLAGEISSRSRLAIIDPVMTDVHFTVLALWRLPLFSDVFQKNPPGPQRSVRLAEDTQLGT